MIDDLDFFPFESYVYSCDEKEYNKDVRKKNNIIKFVNLLTVDELDIVSLERFYMILLFFRNNFLKEYFLYFFLNAFSDNEKRLLASIVFDVFVKSSQGIVGEQKDFFVLSMDLYSHIDRRHPINDKWDLLLSKLYITKQKI
jgi:hypothetical protein